MNRNEIGINVLVCSRGGGGLLFERMELVAELWEENIRVGNLILCKIVWYFCCAHVTVTESKFYRQSLSPCAIQASLNSTNMQATTILNVLLSSLTLVYPKKARFRLDSGVYVIACLLCNSISNISSS